MDKVAVSVVAYLNSQPFIWGLENSMSDYISLTRDAPSICAEKLINNQVDIGLVPIASLPLINGGQIITDYCLAANGKVNSVFLFSDKPLHQIKTISLDDQSMTSNGLVKILALNFWKLDTEFLAPNLKADARVVIGDRTFDKMNSYPYVFDLSEEWKKYTGLPFVFAVWAANKPISNDFIDKFSLALQYGLDCREELIKTLNPVNGFDFRDYLFNKMIYRFSEENKRSMELFLKGISELEMHKV